MLSWNEISNSLSPGVALKSTVLLAAAWLAAWLLRKRSAAIRHLLWSAAFAALLLLPLLTLSLPALRLSAPPPLLPSAIFHALSSASESTPPSTPGQGTSLPSAASFGDGIGWRTVLPRLWALGALISFVQMLLASMAVWRMRRSAAPFPVGAFMLLKQRLGLEGEIEVLQMPSGSMPMTFGLFRPTVFLPSDALAWPRERLDTVLLHELAHVRRGDSRTHLLARAILSFYWWNPLAWRAWNQLLSDRERAADDMVLSSGASASEYATHLLAIASTMQRGNAPGNVAVAMARPSQLEGRLIAILATHCRRGTARRASAIAAGLLTLAVVAPLAAVQSQEPLSSGQPPSPDSLLQAATLAEAVGRSEVAEQLLTRSLNVTAQLSGSQSVAYGVALRQLGDFEREQAKPAEARALYTKALSIFQGGPEAATTLLHLGTVDLKLNADATKDFEQAKSADATKAGEATLWMAISDQHQNHLASAEALYESALAMEDANSSAAATTMELYGQFLRQQGRPAEAQPLETRAATVRKSLDGASLFFTQTGTAPVYRVGGDVKAPVVVTKLQPKYPAEAKTASYQGSVAVYAEIGLDGRAHNMRIVRGLGLGLSERAVDAVSQWTFAPGTKNGQPVTVGATIEINFRLL